jgi:hypothetical protein
MLHMTVSKRKLDASLDRLIFMLSAEGMAAWLGVNVGPWLRHRAAERFASEGDDVTGPWAPLSPATQAIRAEGPWPVGPDHPINRRTGELENWVVQGGWFAYPDGTLGASLQYPKDEPVGELREKVKVAQIGRPQSMGPDKPMTVARPVLGLNEADLAFVMTALSMDIQDVFL